MPIPFSLRQLEYFVAVARLGSVTGAAAASHVSQPSVSTAISELESTLGRTLFRRQAGQRLAITPAGRRLLVQARTILANASRIVDGGPDDLESSEIGISCFKDLGAIYLPRMLTAFARRYPNVAIRLIEGDLAEVRAQLLDGRCEIAITYDIGLGSHPISRQKLDALAPYAMLAAEHPLAASSEVSLFDLAAGRVVIEDFPITRDYFLGLFRKRGIEISTLQLAPSFEMQRGLVASGWGVGLSCVRPAPDFSYDGTRLACLPLASPETPQPVVLAHLGNDTLSSPASYLLSLAGAES